MSNWKDDNPIQSQQEADGIFMYLSVTTATTLNIPMQEAMKRVEALFKSGILNEPGAHPENPETQRKIDNFLKQTN